MKLVLNIAPTHPGQRGLLPMIAGHFELTFPLQQILSEIEDRGMKRKDIALTYSLLLKHTERQEGWWRQINQAIIERWSPAGLVWIKELAWKIAEGKVTA